MPSVLCCGRGVVTVLSPCGHGVATAITVLSQYGRVPVMVWSQAATPESAFQVTPAAGLDTLPSVKSGWPLLPWQTLLALGLRRFASMLSRERGSGVPLSQEYLARLRQIRLQNFNERQQIKARLRGEKYDSDGSDSQESSDEAQLRRQKIEALKVQAQARAAVLKEQLEKKRREAYERERKAWEEHLVSRGVKVAIGVGVPPPGPGPQPGPPLSRPTTPAISMTAALKDVGAEPASLQQGVDDPSKPGVAALQSEKREILRRLNQNLKVQSCTSEEEKEKEEEQPAAPLQGPSPQDRAPSGADRKRWEAGGPPLVSVAQQTLEENSLATVGVQAESPEDRPPSGADRKRWEAGAPPLISVAQQTLEETSLGTVERTSGEVIQLEAGQGEVPRRAWGQSPDAQVLKFLEEAELQPVTLLLESAGIRDDGVTSGSLTSTAEGLSGVANSGAKTQPDPSPGAMVQKQEPSAGDAVQDQEPSSGAVVQRLVPSTSAGKLPLQALLSGPKKGVPKSQETPAAGGSLIPPPPLTQRDAEEPQDVEELEQLEQPEERPPRAAQPPAGAVQAWGREEPKPQQQGPPDGSVTPAESRTEQEPVEKQSQDSKGRESECVEPLFRRLSSPAHRRAVALALLGAQSSQSSQEDSAASRSRSVSPVKHKDNSLLIGLSTGLFDANNPKMLRTCSLPDLSRLFRTFSEEAAGSSGAELPDDHLELEDLEDEQAKAGDQSECEEDNGYEETDEDLQELRASMERLLQEHPSEDYSEEEEEEGASNGSAAEEEAGEPLESVTNGMDEDEDERRSSESDLNEEWHSDGSDEEEESDGTHQDSIFSRLEELRFRLEQDMGFENFIEAYNKIKAIHEDEDENIDLASSLVQDILGTEHQHLYPKILHLVMADGVYQEDNDE
ncbi:serine/threonine-protein kinase Nek1-like [Megalops cyprinoides]|uniref:serine/threonine-protein kinase Nek1-like n=1 Tax=Megalops cyprinoides TaxID=118141 RepID=UPI00186552F8|nr:serine/threonine-protein kinase Nek1-like [Megalops cyprinoides]